MKIVTVVRRRERAAELIDRLATLYEAAISYTHAGLIPERSKAQLYSDLDQAAHALAFDGGEGILELKQLMHRPAPERARGRGHS